MSALALALKVREYVAGWNNFDMTGRDADDADDMLVQMNALALEIIAATPEAAANAPCERTMAIVHRILSDARVPVDSPAYGDLRDLIYEALEQAASTSRPEPAPEVGEEFEKLLNAAITAGQFDLSLPHRRDNALESRQAILAAYAAARAAREAAERERDEARAKAAMAIRAERDAAIRTFASAERETVAEVATLRADLAAEKERADALRLDVESACDELNRDTDDEVLMSLAGTLRRIRTALAASRAERGRA